MKKKILFIAATHGNEGFTIPIMKKLSSQGYDGKFDWLIGNPRALKKDKRFINLDLNRVAPGKESSLKYEIRRAYELQNKFNQYDYVIDLHGTPAKTGIFIIITNPKIENLYLAASLPIKNIVIWSPKNLFQPGPLTQFVKCGLEIECGPKNLDEIQGGLYDILKDFLENGIELDMKKVGQKSFYRVYGTLMKKDVMKKKCKLSEFKKMIINGELFYPLLINRYSGMVCYKMEKININLKNL